MPVNHDIDLSDIAAQRVIERLMLKRLEALHPSWKRIPWKQTAAALSVAAEIVPIELQPAECRLLEEASERQAQGQAHTRRQRPSVSVR